MNVSRIRRTENKIVPISPVLYADLFESGIKLEIGCGDSRNNKDANRRSQGYIGLDILDLGQEIVWDVESGGIPLPDNSCSHIYAAHILEHLDDLIGIMNECHRALREGGELYVVVPHRDHDKAYAPSHVRWFDKWSFEFFEHENYTEGYHCKVWKIIELIVNERNHIHVRMMPIKKYDS